jgi:DNA (cytosine-5)-methyltransferase 1
VADTESRGQPEQRRASEPGSGGHADGGGESGWDDFIIIGCGDGKARRLKPGIAPLVTGFSGRVGLIRGYGNAIVPQTAAAFIEEVMGVIG